MAKTGIEYLVFAKLQEDGTYKDGKRFSEVSVYNGSPTKASASDYGDNRRIESDNSVTGGTLSLEVNKDSDEMKEYILGNKKTEEDGEVSGVIHNTRDVAPFLGTGAIGTSDGKYKVKVYLKTQYSEPNDDNSTKAENTTYAHVTYEGNIFPMENGDWKEEHTFSTFDQAKAWLDKKFGVTDEPVQTNATAQEPSAGVKTQKSAAK